MKPKLLMGVGIFFVTLVSVYAITPTAIPITNVVLTPPNIPADVRAKIAPRLSTSGVLLNQKLMESSLRILGVTLSPSSTDLLLEGTPSWTYNVQSISSFTSTNWMTLGPVTVGSLGSAIFNDTRERLEPSQFYRISKRETTRAVVTILSGLLLPAGSAKIPLAASTTGTNAVLNTKEKVTK